MPEQLSLVLANAIVALATFVQYSTGIGYGMIAMPLLALISLHYVPGPALFTMLSMSLLMAIEGRKHIDYYGFVPLLVSLTFGTVLGAYVLAVMDKTYFGIVFGILILFSIVIGRLGFNPPKNLTAQTIGGFISGFAGTIAGIHGAILAVLFHHMKSVTIRATVAIIFVFAGTVSLICLHYQGLFDASGMKAGLGLLPGLVVGIVLAKLGLKKLKEEHAKLGMVVVAASSALVLLIRSMFDLVTT